MDEPVINPIPTAAPSDSLGGNAAAPAPALPQASQPPEAPVAAPVIPTPAETPSLLESMGAKPELAKPEPAAKAPEAPPPEAKTPEVKPSEPKPGETKPAEAKAAEPAAPDPEPFDYSKIALPENIKAEGAHYDSFKQLLTDHGLPVEAGSKLAKLAGDVMADYAKQLTDAQVKTFLETRQTWAKQIMADPEIGGAGFQTAQSAIARMRDRLISSSAPGTAKYDRDVAEFTDFLRITGAGDHPALSRILHNAAALFDEPQGDRIPPAPRPTKTNGRAPNRGLYNESSMQKMNG